MTGMRTKVAAVAGSAALAFGAMVGTGQAAAAASANASDLDAKGAVTEINRLLLEPSRVGLVPATGRLVHPDGAVKAVTEVVDAATGTLLGTRRSDFAADASGGASKLRECVKNGRSKNVTVFPVENRELKGKAGVVHFQYHPYMLRNARTNGEGDSTTQFEVCTTGGGDLQDGWRLHKAGTGMTIADKSQFLKIGQEWKTGKTPEDYTLSLGFTVPAGKSGAEISGGIEQNPSDKLMGSIVAPYKHWMNDYSRNAVHAWWQDSCVGKFYGCYKWDGSSNFQGAVAHGLWEYQSAAVPPVVYFYFEPHAEWACHGAVKCG
ncbi:MAG: hypothetical protein ACT4QG_03235 [Sporichthyaceae bacterium]